MTDNRFFTAKKLGLGLLCSSAVLLGACGGGSNAGSRSGEVPSQPTPPPAATPTPPPASSAKVSGPLDPAQDQVVTNVVSNQVASQLPEPLDLTVMCGASALNHLIDVPDSILAAAAGAANSSDPFDAFNAAQANVQVSLERFAAQLQATLVSLVERGSCEPTNPGTPGTTNPLAGTPLEPVGAAILALSGALEGTADDPNLTSVTSALAPVLAQLSGSFAMVPAEVRDAPVVGGLIATLQQATLDVAVLLPAVGNYQAVSTRVGIETVVNNLLSNVLLQVVPVAAVEEATGQDFSSQIQAGINTLTGQLGNGLGQLITPLFNQGLNGVLSPILNPVEGLLASIVGGGDALTGVLGQIAGNGNNTGSPADALLAMLVSQQAGLPFADIIAGSGLPAGNPLANLTTLLSDANAAQLDGVLGNLFDLSDTLGLPLIDIVDDVIGSVLDGLLGGLF